MEVHKFEVTAGVGALVVLAAFLSFLVSVVEHMNVDKVLHFSVHHFPFAKLELHKLLLVTFAGERVVVEVFKEQVGGVVSHE